MLSIIDSETGLAIQVPIAVHVECAFRRQIMPLQGSKANEFAERLAPLLSKALVNAMDPESKPPTEQEIRQAGIVSAKSGVAVPQEAWSSKVLLREFMVKNLTGA